MVLFQHENLSHKYQNPKNQAFFEQILSFDSLNWKETFMASQESLIVAGGSGVSARVITGDDGTTVEKLERRTASLSMSLGRGWDNFFWLCTLVPAGATG